MKPVQELLNNLGIIPKNIEVYEHAFTHPSYANENRVKSYQRMEFFGDALLEKSATEYIFFKMTELDEGKMSTIRSTSVSGVMLTQFANDLNFGEYIRFGNKSENLKDNEHVLEDVFEAFVAAIYLDLGQKALEQFLYGNVFKFIKESKGKELKNPKTILQEHLQSESRGSIVYKVREIVSGYEAMVTHDGHNFGKGTGATKKEAEVAAAEDALKLLKTK